MAEPGKKARKRRNLAEKRALKSAALQKFIQQYGRKTQKGGLDPNDRHYSEDIERLIKQMSPKELDRLLREDED
jgi:hypothetical protein